LHVDGSGSREATDQAFATLDTGPAATSSLLDLIVTIPSDQMAIVNDMLFAFLEMNHIHSPITRQPHQPLPHHLINEQVLAAKHGLTEPLTLRLLLHLPRAGQESIFAYIPHPSVIRDLQCDDVAHQRRSQRDGPGSREAGLAHLAAGEHFAHGEFDGAFQFYGRGHVDHGAWFGFDEVVLAELKVQGRVRVAVFDRVVDVLIAP